MPLDIPETTLTPAASGKLLHGTTGTVGRILLNKPGRLNALDEEILEGLESIFRSWEQSGTAAVAVLGSTSSRAFCVGADIERLATFDTASMRRWEALGNRVLDAIEYSSVVSVAAISGHALGGGLTLALACDFRISSEDSQFAQPEIGLGWIPGWGGVRRLQQLTGPAAAKRLCFLGERISATAARDLGIVDELAAAGQVDQAAAAFADRLAAQSPPAMRAIKALASGRGVPAEFDGLANASLLEDPRGQAAIARFLSRKNKDRE